MLTFISFYLILFVCWRVCFHWTAPIIWMCFQVFFFRFGSTISNAIEYEVWMRIRNHSMQKHTNIHSCTQSIKIYVLKSIFFRTQLFGILIGCDCVVCNDQRKNIYLFVYTCMQTHTNTFKHTHKYAYATHIRRKKNRFIVINVMTIHTKWKSKSEWNQRKTGWMAMCSSDEQHCKAICRLSVRLVHRH